MPRGIPNKPKEAPIVQEPEAPKDESRADKLARFDKVAMDANQHPTQRLWAMRQIAEIKRAA